MPGDFRVTELLKTSSEIERDCFRVVGPNVQSHRRKRLLFSLVYHCSQQRGTDAQSAVAAQDSDVVQQEAGGIVELRAWPQQLLTLSQYGPGNLSFDEPGWKRVRHADDPAA